MIHKIFPLAVGQYFFNDHENLKNEFHKILPEISVNQNNRIKTGEITGFTDVHNRQELSGLFRFVADSMRFHFDELLFCHDIFDIFITKSWITLLYNDMVTPLHTHDTSHYSFSYYLDAPEGSDHLCFVSQKQPNEPFGGAFFENQPDGPRNLIYNYIDVNSMSWSFPVKTGDLFIFPSHLPHCSKKISSINDKKRVCIAGDVFLVYKDDRSPNYPTGIFPLEKWKKF